MQAIVIKFIKFGIVGATGIGVDFGITWLLKERAKVNKYLANSIGFLCAVMSNFMLNRLWTFESTDPNIGWQFGKFFIVALIGLGLNNGIIYLLTERAQVRFYPAKLIATGIVVIWNFGANVFFTFK